MNVQDKKEAMAEIKDFYAKSTVEGLLFTCLTIKEDIKLKRMNELGICGRLEYHHTPRYNQKVLVKALARLWDKYTGEEAFPVPHPTDSPLVGYMKASEAQMWYAGTYAKNRRELLDFLIESLQTMLNES